jgi:hypothetical protein
MIHFGLSREITREGWGWGASRLGALHGREGEGGSSGTTRARVGALAVKRGHR